MQPTLWPTSPQTQTPSLLTFDPFGSLEPTTGLFQPINKTSTNDFLFLESQIQPNNVPSNVSYNNIIELQ